MSSTKQEEEVCVDCAPTSSSNTNVESQKPVQPEATASQTVDESIRPPLPESFHPNIIIEFCDRCRWAPRAGWIQTELFLTFPVPIIKSITLQPLTSPETGGRFRVWIITPSQTHLAWDRKTEGGFPELKVLKQRIRNVLQPDLNLGHSDKPGKPVISSSTTPAVPVSTTNGTSASHSQSVHPM